jgi:hypothetical protein
LAVVTLLLGACDAPDQEESSRKTEPAPSSPAAATLFRDAAAEAGLSFHHVAGATGNFFFPEIMGAGVALLDYDADGDVDLFLAQGRLIDPEADPSALLIPTPSGQPTGGRLFRNELVPGGRLRFTDVTESSGILQDGYGMGAAVGDLDNDGYPDLYLTQFGDNRLYRNQGDGTFRDITAESGTNDPRWSTSAAFVDYDLDGDLDLFVTNYVQFNPKANRRCTGSGGARDYCGPQVFEGTTDRLFRNDGRGRFTDVSQPAGIGAVSGPGLGVTVADFDLDGRPDLYVANDGEANRLWMNRGEGRFEDAGLMAGAAFNMDGKAEASMGVTAGDFDGDGDEDLFMTHLASETNTLYLNDGTGLFFDSTSRLNLGGASLPYTGFGSQWLDFDNDGRLDLFVANGAVKIEASRLGVSPYPYEQRNQLFRNPGDGRFVDQSQLAGPAFELLEVSRGAAFGDIDNDGDVDILVTNNNGPVRLLLNEMGNEKHWLSVRLEGTESNRDGAGARVALLRTGKPPLWRRAHTDGSYLSASDIRVHFGLGDDTGIEAVGVEWPGGRRELWRGVRADRQLELKEGTGEPWPSAGR